MKTPIDYRANGGVSDSHRANLIRPAQHVTQWLPCGDVGDYDPVNSAETSNDPTSFDNRSPMRVGAFGTNLRVRLNYEEGNVEAAAPIVRVYGYTACPDAPTGHVGFQLLHNRAQEIDVPLVAAANDVNVNGRKVTRANQETHMWDLDGCEYIVVSVRNAYGVEAGGDATDAFIEIKVI